MNPSDPPNPDTAHRCMITRHFIVPKMMISEPPKGGDYRRIPYSVLNVYRLRMEPVKHKLQ